MSAGSHGADELAHPLTRYWGLDRALTFLNHGSFGACPSAVLEEQSRLRARLERDPVRFMAGELEGLLDAARAEHAAFGGAEAADHAFRHNATTAVSAVLRSIAWRAGEEVLITDHTYNACRNAVVEIAGAAGANVVIASVPFPGTTEEAVLDAVMSRVTARTRLALLDHITSPTGLVMPIERLVGELAARGVDVYVDGAHAPGHVPLAIEARGAAYYTGNCHKWMCAPKGAGFLWARRDRQADLRPLVISHGANSPRTDRSRFRLEFDWLGTDDAPAFLCVPVAIRHLASLVPGGWDAIRTRNRAMALAGRAAVCAALGVEPPCEERLVGCMASIPLPEAPAGRAPHPWGWDPLQERLRADDALDVLVTSWPRRPKRLVRISAQLYNVAEDYQRLASALPAQLAREA